MAQRTTINYKFKMTQYPLLQKSIIKAPVIEINDGIRKYKFEKVSFGERGTFLDRNLISEISKGLTKSIVENFPEYDSILSCEPGGHLWGILCAYSLNKSIYIVRKDNSQFPAIGTILNRETGYSKELMHGDILREKERILILEDVVSTGKTSLCLNNYAKSSGAEVVGVQCIYLKNNASKKIFNDLNISLRYLISKEET